MFFTPPIQRKFLLVLTLFGLALCAPLPGLASGVALHTETGKASWYGPRFHGQRTASGQRFDRNALVAAHPRLPLGSLARITNLDNGRSVEVAIIDRGPARSAQRRGVIIDLSQGAARQLDYLRQGKAPVRVEVLRWGESAS